jgi:TatA/E family protein of Tat protein translocase
MFGLGIGEIIVIVVVGLMVLGPRRLPEIARQIGRVIRELRRAAYELQVNLEEATPPPPKRAMEPPPPPLPDAPATSTPDADPKPPVAS